MSKKSLCMQCKTEVNDEVKECECGCVTFVYGENFSFDNHDVICNCGNKSFNRVMHMDYKDKYANNYSCSNCKNAIGVESYRTGEDKMLWED